MRKWVLAITRSVFVRYYVAVVVFLSGTVPEFGMMIRRVFARDIHLALESRFGCFLTKMLVGVAHVALGYFKASRALTKSSMS